MKSFKIQGTGTAVPKKRIDSKEIDDALGLPVGTTESETGVASRFYAVQETATDLAVEAIQQALDIAQLSLADIDCLIGASGTLEQAIPYNAARVHAQLGCDHTIPAFDVNMTCLSSVMAMELAANLLVSNTYQRIAIFSSDLASVGLRWSDRHIGGLFGDGAGALIVSRGENPEQGIHSSYFQTHSEGVEHCQIRGGGSLNHPTRVEGDYKNYGYFEMQGKEVYRITTKHIQPFIGRLFADLPYSFDDIDWIVPHQASKGALLHLKKKLHIDPKKMIDIISTRGNQIAASIPTALHELLSTKPVKPGDKVLVFGTSAGLSMGGLVISL